MWHQRLWNLSTEISHISEYAASQPCSARESAVVGSLESAAKLFFFLGLCVLQFSPPLYYMLLRQRTYAGTTSAQSDFSKPDRSSALPDILLLQIIPCSTLNLGEER